MGNLILAETSGAANDASRFDVRLNETGGRIRVVPQGGGSISFRVADRDALNTVAKGVAIVMSKLQAEGLTDETRQALVEELTSLGDHFWFQVFTLSKGADRFSEWVIPLVVKKHQQAGFAVIVVEGSWASLPWELVRVPGEFLPDGRARWLGELAIISSIIQDDSEQTESAGHLATDTTGYSNPARYFESGRGMAAVFGDQHSAVTPHGLKYLNEEVDAIQMRIAGGAPIRVLAPLPISGSGSRDCIRDWSEFLQKPIYPQLFHLAAHHQDLRGGMHVAHLSENPRTAHHRAKYQVSLRTATVLTDVALRDFSVGGPAVAFLNVCSASATGWAGAPAFAEDLINHHQAVAVVASPYEINDRSAVRFSKVFLDHFLPQPWGNQLQLGESVFRAREALLSEGSLTGLCYRLLGSHDIRLTEEGWR